MAHQEIIYQRLLQIKLALFLLVFLNSTGIYAQNNGKSLADGSYYSCTMDPQVHNDAPGTCPICGMALVKIKAKKVKAKGKSQVNSPKSLPMVKDTIGIPITDKVKLEKEPLEEDLLLSKVSVKTVHDSIQSVNIHSSIHSIGVIAPRTIRYDLFVRDTLVDFTGKNKRAIAVNGQIPMPTLTFTEGDTAEIYVHNELDEETSMHWHGIFLPNKYDGVPNLTQMPIKAHTTHLYKFPIVQHGTHWYHSHTGLQEQIGMYGSMILNKKMTNPTFRKGIDDLTTIPIILSEWTNLNPKQVHRMLHNATDWFAIKKGTTQSYSEAIHQGYFKTKVTNEWKRMNAMDVSDVYYEKFLINGKSNNQFSALKPGEKVRLRISNGGASTYFWLTYGGGKITIVANDGNDVEPVEVDRLIIAVSETYDVIVTIPNDSVSNEFLVTAEDRTNSASLFLGPGVKQLSMPLPKLKYFEGMKMMNDMMRMNGKLDDMGMQMSLNEMDMNVVMYPEITGETEHKWTHEMSDMKNDTKLNDTGITSDIVTLNYTMLKSTINTLLPKNVPVKEFYFQLSGNMNRYVWSLDNKVVSESDKILIRKGENIRLILYNGSMMRHPMHLHGHDFRLLNGQSELAPLKNIVDIMPMETDTLEFNANAEGDWFFHCHILYHMMSGMGRVFSYENQAANPEIPNPKLAQRKLFADDRKFHSMARMGLESNGTDGEAMIANTRWKISTLWHLGFHARHGYESETMIGRYFGKMQWVYAYTGFDYHFKIINVSEKNIFGNDDTNLFGQKSNKNDRKTGVIGITYTLPMLFLADARIDFEGKFRLQLGREDIPISKRLRMNIMFNSDKEYMIGGRYILTKYFSLSSHYDSDMGIGIGCTLMY